MPALDERVASLEVKMEAVVDLRTDIRDLRTEMVQLRTDMNRQFQRVEDKVDKHFTWVVGILMTFFIALVSTLVTVAAR